MIASAFICGPHGQDDCWLPHRLRIASLISDAVFVLLDRSPESEAICKRFPKVRVMHYEGASLPMKPDGVACSEGAMRQAVWDLAVKSNPEWVVLSDTDEVPAPSIVPLLAKMPPVDVLLADWVNLIFDANHAIGGRASPWSYQKPGVNKKGLIVRYLKERKYRYRTDATRHVRLEPSPLHEAKTMFSDTHRLGPVPLLHLRWGSWDRWRASEAAKLPYYLPWPPADATIVPVPREWKWSWDADDLLRALPEPVAVVGNGPCVGKGAEIDAAACVVRFNNWVTAGYEEHVGRRCDLWVTNVWEDVAMRPWTGDMLAIHSENEQPARLARWLGAYPHMAVPRGSWIARARRLKRSIPCNPSTGLTFLNRLSGTAKRFTAYGFDGMTGGHYWQPEHQHNHGREVDALKSFAGIMR